jgi:hypothetical protein
MFWVIYHPTPYNNDEFCGFIRRRSVECRIVDNNNDYTNLNTAFMVNKKYII